MTVIRPFLILALSCVSSVFIPTNSPEVSVSSAPFYRRRNQGSEILITCPGFMFNKCPGLFLHSGLLDARWGPLVVLPD